MDADFENLDATGTGAAAGGADTSQVDAAVGGDGGDSSSAIDGDGDGGAALHAALECIELWSREDPHGVGARLAITLPAALASVHAARLRTRILALRCLSVCIGATPEILRALEAPRSVADGAAAAASGEQVAGADGPANSELVKLAHSWKVPAVALLDEARQRLQKAASRVKKIKPETRMSSDSIAGHEASVAAAAANLDYTLRRAVTTAAAFARAAPAVLPLGGSVHELEAFKKLWAAVEAIANERGVADTERGGHGLAVRDLQRMLPLTPAARLAVYDGLRAHVEMYVRLHGSLKHYRDPDRPEGEAVPFLDGSMLDQAVEIYDDHLLEGLKDTQWAVRENAISALSTCVYSKRARSKRTRFPLCCLSLSAVLPSLFSSRH